MPNHDSSTRTKQENAPQHHTIEKSARLSLGGKRWQTHEPAPRNHIECFSKLRRPVAQVLYNRDITTLQEFERFRETYCPGDPLELKGMHQAVRNIKRSIEAKEKIAVYGDFDVDGVTATALMVETLEMLGANVIPHIPRRIEEGYGLNLQSLRDLWERGVRLVITVDCGIRDVDDVRQARKGLDIIITDHHSVGPTLPPAITIINPKQTDCPYPFKDLAGVGVAFKLAQALLQSHRSVKDEHSPTEDNLLDLVALGTVADIVPLRGENRYLVKRGMEKLNNPQRPGIQALMERTRLQPGEINTWAIGFVIGPRLNAAGRLDTAMLSYNLLTSKSLKEAKVLAEKLEEINQKRQRLTVDMVERARGQVIAEPLPLLLFTADDGFHPGIVGLVANRLSDEFYRPSVVVELGTKESRGSCRSIPEFNIVAALDKCADLLVRYGGHDMAAGFTVTNENLSALSERLVEIASSELSDLELRPTLVIDAEVELSEMDNVTQDQLEQLEPYGRDNPQPLFASYDVRVLSQRAVGKKEVRHLKLTLSDGQTRWDGIAFRQGEWAGKLPDLVDVVYHLEINEWNDRQRLQLNVQDVRPSGLDEAIS